MGKCCFHFQVWVSSIIMLCAMGYLGYSAYDTFADTLYHDDELDMDALIPFLTYVGSVELYMFFCLIFGAKLNGFGAFLTLLLVIVWGAACAYMTMDDTIINTNDVYAQFMLAIDSEYM
ncbi:hypothetical protein KIPB_012969, partial [Kipferlia bialata]|eukprot:g12969.t1